MYNAMHKRKKFSRRSISTRWFLNSLGVVIALLVFADALAFVLLRGYYYSGIGQYLRTQANIIHGVMSYIGDYEPEIRKTVETFELKDQMELMAIADGAKVEITSSGFAFAGEKLDMPDYQAALAVSDTGSEDAVGEYEGYNANGEHYMAVSVMLPDSERYSAVRLVTSLDKTDTELMKFTLAAGIASVLILLLVVLLGLYFVRSIVSPLRQIGQNAGRLAAGDFSARIHISKSMMRNMDEIGELCRIFNDMADKLQNSEEIKNTFLSSVSHELRTPLTAIQGWSETLLNCSKDKESVKGLRVILSETQRLSAMVEELLDFTHMQSGRFSLNFEPIDALAELSEAVLAYEERAHQSEKIIRFDIPEAAAVVLGDKHRLRQVFINIIDNALKYCDKEIDITAAEIAGYINVTVKDDGRGIPAADLPKVKKRFFKAANALRGSGIGLSVASEIVERLGGVLEIASEQGQGAAVTIALPLFRK
jgi:signal transduction histidine kinase